MAPVAKDEQTLEFVLPFWTGKSYFLGFVFFFLNWRDTVTQQQLIISLY